MHHLNRPRLAGTPTLPRLCRPPPPLCSETWIRQEDGTKVYQEPSPQDRGARQLVCHCDELELALQHDKEQQRRREDES